MKWMRVIALATMLALPLFLAACSKPAGTTEASEDPEEAFLAGVHKSAGVAPTVTDASSTGAPKVELQTAHYDMGVIPGNAIAVQSMKIYNRGTAPLKIVGVQTSCGCTTGEMDQNLIPAGGEGRLIIRVDPKKIPGFQTTKVLTLTTNDPQNTRLTVDVTTTVAPEMEVVPDTVDFGRIPQGEGFKQTIRVRQLQDEPLEVTGAAFQKDLPFLAAKLTPVPEAEWRTPGKREYTIAVEIAPDAPAGELNEWFIISSNVARMPQYSMRIKGGVTGPFEFSSPTVTLRGVTAGTPATDVLTLTSKEAVTILEIANSNPAIQPAHRATADPKVVVFDLTVPQASASQTLRDTWRIVFETGGTRREKQIPVVIVLTREN
jgi:hypothetical protein